MLRAVNQAVEQGPDDEHLGFVAPLCPVHGRRGRVRPGTVPDLPARS